MDKYSIYWAPIMLQLLRSHKNEQVSHGLNLEELATK